MTREFDVVLFGATGFTGRLVAEYLARAHLKLAWAVAGRSREKLEALGTGRPVLVADAHDAVALAQVARRTRVVCTTVGPYSLHGSALVAACAEAGTHCCDLCGEPQWIRRMIDTHHQQAQQSGAKLVHCCGFDAIPSDLGTWALQQAFKEKFGGPAARVTAYFEMKGGLSGGTIASGVQSAVEADAEASVREVLANPYALDPEPSPARPPAPDETGLGWDKGLRRFTTPFLMASINTRVVRRAHALARFPWGADFVYREVMATAGTPAGLLKAMGNALTLAGTNFALKRPWLRARVARWAPQPGEGPSEAARARGRWKVRLVGERGSERLEYVAADDHGDPGYASTAKMLGESAVCLATDALEGPGGSLTPSVAMGAALVERLRRAGLTFALANAVARPG